MAGPKAPRQPKAAIKKRNEGTKDRIGANRGDMGPNGGLYAGNGPVNAGRKGPSGVKMAGQLER